MVFSCIIMPESVMEPICPLLHALRTLIWEQKPYEEAYEQVHLQEPPHFDQPGRDHDRRAAAGDGSDADIKHRAAAASGGDAPFVRLDRLLLILELRRPLESQGGMLPSKSLLVFFFAQKLLQ